MEKNIIIGIGGTGLSAIREIRRLIAERYKDGLQNSEVQSTRFFYIDTDENDENQRNWSFLGKNISLKDYEKTIISGDGLQDIINNLENYPNFNSWLPNVKNYVGEPGNGAKGIRAYGRLVYEYQANKQNIENSLTSLFNDLNKNCPEANKLRFHLVAGLSGGTGSGIFLPLAWDLQNWDLYKREENFKLFSYLVLPPLQLTSDYHNRVHSNTYAALKELNYYACQQNEQQLPFDNCYLVEPQNEDSIHLDREALPVLIAQRIFLEIQESEASQKIVSIMDNPDVEIGELEEDNIAQRFSTFGVSTIFYPREIVAQCLAYSFTDMVIDEWLKTKGEYSQNFNQQVQSELPNLYLSEKYIYGDASCFNPELDFDDYQKEIQNEIDQQFNQATKANIADLVRKTRDEIEYGFRGFGLKGFYQQRKADVEGAVNQSVQELNNKISYFIRDPNLGIDYAKKFVEELLKILKDKKEYIANNLIGDNASNIRQTKYRNLQTNIQEIRRKQDKLIYFGFKNDREDLFADLKKYLRQEADFYAGEFANSFLNSYINNIEDYPDQIEGLRNYLNQFKEYILGKKNTNLNNIDENLENGLAIFDQTSLNKLSQNLENDIFYNIKHTVEETIQFNILKLPQKSNDQLENQIYSSIYNWLISDKCQIEEINQTNLYNKLVEFYPDEINRQKRFKNIFTFSNPFLKFDEPEIAQRQTNLPSKVTIATIPKGVGKASEQDETPNQVKIKDDLKAIDSSLESTILESNDQERIVFLSERQSFPLRYIASLKRLKEKYEAFSDISALHIDKHIVPKLYNLYLLTPQERSNLAEAKQTFIMSRILGELDENEDNLALREKTNNRTQQTEIRYEYSDVGTQVRVLGSSWDEAFQNFTQEPNIDKIKDEGLRNARQRLVKHKQEKLDQMRRNKEEYDKFVEMSNEYLTKRENEYRDGIDDPRYQRDQTLIKEILNQVNHE